MKMNTQQIESTVPTHLPRASGGGGGEADGGGLHSSPPKLTAALTRDLLDPTVSALDLCDYHNLNLNQLVAIINSIDFKKLKAAIEEINTARQALIKPEARTAALTALTEITRRPIDSQQAAETARRAAAKLEQITRSSLTQGHHPNRPKSLTMPPRQSRPYPTLSPNPARLTRRLVSNQPSPTPSFPSFDELRAPIAYHLIL